MRFSLLGVVASMLLFCAGSAAAAEPTPVVLQLRFDHQFQFAGYYAALWNGYYKEAGVDVTLRSGVRPDGSVVDVVEELASGRAQFGVAASDALLAIDRGVPLVLLASIFQQSAVEVVAKDDAGVRAPADLVGLKIQSGGNQLLDAEFLAMLAAEGVDPQSVTLIPMQGGYQIGTYLERLFSDEVDATIAYGLSVPWYARERGVAYFRLRPSTYGVDFYGDSLFTHKRVVDSDPQLVERFTRASLKGWAYALEHRDEIIERIVAELPRTVPVSDLRSYNQFVAGRVKDLTLHPYMELGHINPARWRQMQTSLKRVGLVDGDLDMDEFIFDPENLRRDAVERRYRATLYTAGVVTVLLLAVAAYLSARRIRERAQARAELERANDSLRMLNEQLEHRIDERTAELQRVNRDLESFSYSVSHDLRAPLRAMHGYGAMLASAIAPRLTDEERRLMERLQTNALLMSTIVDSLLELSQLTRNEIVKSEVDLSALAEDILERLRDAEPERNVQADIQPHIVAEGDRRLLDAVLTNLLGNAWKFTSAQPDAHIRFFTERRDGETVYVVSDDGVGFDMSHAAHLFAPFQRLHGAHEYPGTGVGLAIVQRVIEKHGGRIWADSAPGRGTRMYFTLGAEPVHMHTAQDSSSAMEHRYPSTRPHTQVG